jgi:hypothetical protein
MQLGSGKVKNASSNENTIQRISNTVEGSLSAKKLVTVSQNSAKTIIVTRLTCKIMINIRISLAIEKSYICTMLTIGCIFLLKIVYLSPQVSYEGFSFLL